MQTSWACAFNDHGICITTLSKRLFIEVNNIEDEFLLSLKFKSFSYISSVQSIDIRQLIKCTQKLPTAYTACMPALLANQIVASHLRQSGRLSIRHALVTIGEF